MVTTTYYVKFQHSRRGWRETEPTAIKEVAQADYDHYMKTSDESILQVILMKRTEEEI